MKTVFKRVLCLLLSLTMVLSITCVASAESIFKTSTNAFVMQIDGGELFFSQTAERHTAIAIDEDSQNVLVSILYTNQPEKVYEWNLIDYSVPTFRTVNSTFWNDVVLYAETMFDSANMIPITMNFSNSDNMRSSTTADLYEDLEDLVGTQYDWKLRAGQSYQGESFRVYDSMEFTIQQGGSKIWNQAISVTSFVVSILSGLPTGSSTLSTVCTALGIALSTAAFIPAGKLNIYYCYVVYDRYITINGSSYVYNVTEKYTSYIGYEDASLSSTERAYIDSSSSTGYTYIDSETYYNSYQLQIEDAYEMFERIGQKP